jgi:alpha-ketoglutarate-dependent taurine dioxygenase
MAIAEIESEAVPLALVAGDDAPLEQADAAAIRSLIETEGAVLLRGFATTVEGFAALARSLCTTSVFNESPNREALGDGVGVQSVDLGSDPFPLHPELAREPWRPDLAMFACLDPPAIGGQTNVCDGIAIAEGLPAELRRELEGKRLFYIRPASPEMLRYWLGTDRPDDALLAGPPPACPYWFRRSPRGLLRGFTRPVLEPTLFQGRPAFANFLLFARDYLHLKRIPLLDGQAFDDDMVDTIRSIARSLSYSHRWQQGDVLLLDNSRFMHGRKAIAVAGERRIATYFGYLEGIERREGEPPDPIWRRETFMPPEKPGAQD